MNNKTLYVVYVFKNQGEGKQISAVNPNIKQIPSDSIEKLMLFVVIFTIITRFEFIYIFFLYYYFIRFSLTEITENMKMTIDEQLYGFVKETRKKDKKEIVKNVYLFESNNFAF